MKETEAFKEIYNRALLEIEKCQWSRVISWHLKLDFEGKYSTSKINYELEKAVRKGLLAKRVTRGCSVEYTKIESSQNPNK